MWKLTNFIFLVSKINADGDCSHKIIRFTLLGSITMTNLDSVFGEGNGNPLQCSCLENPRDGGAWWAAICGVAQSRTRLKWLSSSSLYLMSFFCSRILLRIPHYSYCYLIIKGTYYQCDLWLLMLTFLPNTWVKPLLGFSKVTYSLPTPPPLHEVLFDRKSLCTAYSKRLGGGWLCPIS